MGICQTPIVLHVYVMAQREIWVLPVFIVRDVTNMKINATSTGEK